MKPGLPLKEMLEEKGERFETLFVKVMNLHMGTPVGGRALSEKDRLARIGQAIRESFDRKDADAL